MQSGITLIYILAGIILVLGLFLVVLTIKNRQRISDLRDELQDRTAELELQVERAKASVHAKSSFLSQMSHEIRTPLNAIMGMIQILRGGTEQDLIVGYIEKMEDSARHLLGILNDILDFSKIESDGLILDETNISLRQNVDFVTSMLKEKALEKRLDFSVKFDGIAHDGIITDALRLNQVLINLLSNAVKFTDEGGKIALTVEELAYVKGEGVYRFTVEDSGVGIDPEQAKKLFTPFTQANGDVSRLYGGTGLGLAIAQNIVQMMGGEIELETQLGQGAVFSFTIRAKATETTVEKQPEGARAILGKFQNRRFLVVDDIEINREIIIALLNGSGAAIETASNGREALDIFFTSAPHWFDVVLMDVQMPVMGGCEATDAIRTSERADARDVKIIAMTANVLPEDMARAYEAGMNGYLAKPIEMNLLYETLEAWL